MVFLSFVSYILQNNTFYQKKTLIASAFIAFKLTTHFKPSKDTTMLENKDLSSKNSTMKSIKDLIREEEGQTKTNSPTNQFPYSLDPSAGMQNGHVPYLIIVFFSHFMVIHELIVQFSLLTSYDYGNTHKNASLSKLYTRNYCMLLTLRMSLIYP